MKKDICDIVENAVLTAVEYHSGAKRKGTDLPYILHPMECGTIAAGITEDREIIAAAILHDTVEDTEMTFGELEKRFGARVASLVAGDSEDKREDRPAEETWKVRKEETLRHLEKANRDEVLIALCDKLSNLRSILRDHRAIGDRLWERFNQKDPKEQLWYYSSFAGIFEKHFPEAEAVDEYLRLIKELRQRIEG